jgi:hypothetical protein
MGGYTGGRILISVLGRGMSKWEVTDLWHKSVATDIHFFGYKFVTGCNG